MHHGHTHERVRKNKFTFFLFDLRQKLTYGDNKEEGKGL